MTHSNRIRTCLEKLWNTVIGGPARRGKNRSLAPHAALEQRVLLVSLQNFNAVAPPALPAGWTQTTSAGATWATFSNGGVGNTGHVFLSGPAGAGTTELVSPTVAITTNSQLTFQHTWLTEAVSASSHRDGGMLEISINGGAFADIIAAGGAFVAGGYNGTIASGGGTTTAGRGSWGGNSPTFTSTTVNLPASAVGQNVQFRWRFSSNSTLASGGWGIDSIELNEADRNDQISEALLVGDAIFNTTSLGSVIDNPYDVFMVAFDVTAGQTLAFDLDFALTLGRAPMTDSVLRLFDAAGTQLAFNDDANAPGETASPARESFIRHTFASAGRYYVGVSAAGNRDYSATTGEGDTAGTNSGGFLLLFDRTPAVTITMADTALRVGETSLVTFTFSEAVTGFANADVTVENGTLSTITQVGASNVYTATFTPNADITDTTNLITVTGAGFTDAKLNPGSNASSPNYTIDNVRPTATITMSDTALKVGETSRVTFLFSELVTGFTNSDLIVVQNGTLSAVTSVDGGLIWTGLFTPNANVNDTTNVIGLDLAGITDLAGNAGVGGVDSPNYTIDTAAPTVLSVIRKTPLARLTNASSVTYTVTFSEAVTGIDRSDFTSLLGGTNLGFNSSVTGSGAVYDFTINGLAGRNGEHILLVLDGYTDAAGNRGNTFLMAYGSGYVIDNIAPTARVTMSDTALKVGETSLVTFTFSEPVTGFTNSDLIVVQNGTLSAVTSADGGVTWTGTFTPNANVNDTTNVIGLNLAGITDLAGNAGVGGVDSPNYTVATTRPTVSITMSDTALKALETAMVTFTFSEPVTEFTNADLTVENGTLTNVINRAGGRVWNATFRPNANVTDPTNLIRLNLAGVQNQAGNAGAGIVSSPNYAIDVVRPTVVITMSDTALRIGETSLVTFSFSEVVTDFSNADLNPNDAMGTLSPVQSTNGGTIWTATFTPSANTLDPVNLIRLNNYLYTDLAGNTGLSASTSGNFLIDTRPQSAAANRSLLGGSRIASLLAPQEGLLG